MKIDCELTDEEEGALALMMGAATAILIMQHRDKPEMARTCVRIMNKLYSLTPNYMPYDENSFDAASVGFPFKKTNTP
jgi:hypothetical protein